MNAKIKNTHSVLNASLNIGKNNDTISVPIFSTSAEMPVAAPRARIGNNSGSITHRTGPQEIPKNTINNDKQTIIIHADEAIPIVQIKIAIINNEAIIPILPPTSSFLRSILSTTKMATIVTRTLIVPIPTEPNIDAASPSPALAKIEDE